MQRFSTNIHIDSQLTLLIYKSLRSEISKERNCGLVDAQLPYILCIAKVNVFGIYNQREILANRKCFLGTLY